MNLHDVATAFDDPVEGMLGFHRRIERQLAALGELPYRIEISGLDPAAIAAAACALDFFSRAVELHHADEEDLMRVLRIGDLGEDIAADHRDMERTWKSLRRPLQAIAEGVKRNLPVDLIEYFRASHATHIAFEEARLHLAAARCLQAPDRATVGRGMAARRTRSFRFQ
jgi:hemerythrin